MNRQKSCVLHECVYLLTTFYLYFFYCLVIWFTVGIRGSFQYYVYCDCSWLDDYSMNSLGLHFVQWKYNVGNCQLLDLCYSPCLHNDFFGSYHLFFIWINITKLLNVQSLSPSSNLFTKELPFPYIITVTIGYNLIDQHHEFFNPIQFPIQNTLGHLVRWSFQSWECIVEHCEARELNDSSRSVIAYRAFQFGFGG